jgi:hypothetical protein
MKRLFSLIVGVFALVAPHASQAQDAPTAGKPVPKAGDVHEYARRFVTVNCPRWEVKQVDEKGFLVAQCKDNLAYLSVMNDYNLTKIVTQDGEILVEFKPYSPTLSFPLKLGKKWSGTYTGYTADDGNRWVGNVSCEVTSYETLRLRAGDLPSYRIDCVDNWELGNLSGHAYSTSWYSPKARAVVKMSNKQFPKWDMELVSYTIK